MENRKHAGDHLAQAIDELRSDPMLQNSNLVEVLKLDPAGEWHCQNDDFNDKMKARQVLVDTKMTNIDKRQMAHGEGAVLIMELTAKRIMLSTRLEAEMWNYAIRHAALMRNLHVRVKDAARDGDGPRPLEALSNGFTSRAECDRIRYYAQNPGTAALVEIKEKGSSMTRLARTRWARALFTDRDNQWWECPYTRSRFASKNFVVIELKDCSIFEFLGLPQPGTMPTDLTGRFGRMPEPEPRSWLSPLTGRFGRYKVDGATRSHHCYHHHRPRPCGCRGGEARWYALEGV